MKRLGLILLLAISACTCRAELALTSIGVHLVSHHWPAQDFNNNNPGIYATVSDGEWEYVFGTYYNSERRQTVYGGLNFQITSWFSIQAGLATGYRWPVAPAVVPTLHLPIAEGTTVNFSVLPKFEKSGSWVLHISTQYRF